MATGMSLRHVEVDLGGHIITGWSDDSDALTLPGDSPDSNYRVGADGDITYFDAADGRGGEVTFKLLPDSSSVPYLQQQSQVQREGTRVSYPLTITNSVNGNVVTGQRGKMMSSPKGWTMGKDNVNNMEYAFMFEDLDGQWDNVSLRDD